MYNSIFISDVHLGSAGCHSQELLDFLKSHPSNNLFILGDFFDFWVMQKTVRWNKSYNDLLRHIFKRAKNGCRVIYIPGNHDEVLKEYAGSSFDTIEIHKDYLHITNSGLKVWLIHGDDYDSIVRLHPTIAKLGSWSYDLLITVNNHLNRLRKRIGYKRYWSFSAYIKHQVKDAVNFIAKFEDTVTKECSNRGYDAVMCGHIHRPCEKMLNGVYYYNTGDWVENLSAIIEDLEGNLNVKFFHGNNTGT